MVKRVQHVRHTEANADLFQGLEGEFTYVTDSIQFRIHDAVTTGGYIILPVNQLDTRYVKTDGSTSSLTIAQLNINGVNVNSTFAPTGSGKIIIASGGISTIDNTNVGATTPGTGKFTTLQATAIGGITPGTGVFTTLSATGAVTFTPANAAVSLSPTGTGTVTINPAAAGTINNTSIGATTKAAGGFTTLAATGAVTLSPASANVVLSPTGTGVVTIAPATAGTIDNIAIGVTTKAAGNFTTIGATSTGSGAFTTLSATGAITSTLATGTAPFTITSTTVVGNLNVSQLLGQTWAIPGSIGATTPAAGAFTTLTASAGVTLSPASANVVISPSGTGVVTIAPATVGSINNVTLGVTTPRAANFTTLGATTKGTGAFTTLTGTSSITLGANSGTAGSIILNGSSTGAVTITTGGTAAGTYSFQLPTAGGGAGTYLAWGTPLTWATPASGPIVSPPQGRILAGSNKSGVGDYIGGSAGAGSFTTFRYVAYHGGIVPVFDGTSVWTYFNLDNLQYTLNATGQPSGNLYDIYAYNNSGVGAIVLSPAWTSTSSRGVGTSALILQDGILVNSASFTGFGTNTTAAAIAIGAKQGTYVGSIYMTAGGTYTAPYALSAVGGGNVIWAIYNAYNRIPITLFSQDTTASWTYSTTTARPANNNTNNRITFIDGIGMMSGRVVYNVNASVAGTGGTGKIGYGVNSTTILSTQPMAQIDELIAASVNVNVSVEGYFYPPLTSAGAVGLQFVQAMEIGDGTNSITFTGGATTKLMTLAMTIEA